MKTHEIRTLFLEFFAKKGHKILPSSGLVPLGDPTLLFNNAGMNQFKNIFLGLQEAQFPRVTTCQKCVRAGGKHNDLENVGFTSRHHTFFEMLGNFSFGDYFKESAILYAWEFVTQGLKIPAESLYVSVFQNDDESFDLWHKKVGLSRDRIFRLGEKDNFWQMGDQGPCGPCSEIFVDRGKEVGCKRPTCSVGCDCDRFLEFWNLVFMQFDRQADGTLLPLPKPCVDTGAGLERLASILQNKPTNFDIDIFEDLIALVDALRPKGPIESGFEVVAPRVIVDHARAAAFLIADGVFPSNEGRGYVLRRMIRRAVRYGKKLGFSEAFLGVVASQGVVRQMGHAYPELLAKKNLIESVVKAEEEQFFLTLEKGLVILEDQIKEMGSARVFPGKTAFLLYDTYGFPLDLTVMICQEKGLTVDHEAFEQCMQQQKLQSKKSWKGDQGLPADALDAEDQTISAVLASKAFEQAFTGYEQLVTTGTVLGLFQDSQQVSLARAGDKPVRIICDQTPFYAMSGGQVSDEGFVSHDDGFFMRVLGVKKIRDRIVVQGLIEKGEIQEGKSVRQQVDTVARKCTASNHTATHLLHAALKMVLGDHVKQAGSLVHKDFLRFDFAHHQPLSGGQILAVENLINERIFLNTPVQKQTMKKEEALLQGAVAHFEDKYLDEVRVVTVEDFSKELCGGTHVDQLLEIRLFKILQENGIAGGVRRITAVTSQKAVSHFQTLLEKEQALLSSLRGSSLEDVAVKFEKLGEDLKEMRKKCLKFQSQQFSRKIDELVDSKGFLTVQLESECFLENPFSEMRQFVDQLHQKAPEAFGVILVKGDAQVLVAVFAAKQGSALDLGSLVKKLNTAFLGKGGGNKVFAQTTLQTVDLRAVQNWLLENFAN
jgi:alanyl-tRNA synthetase